jgi:hypothetical protein
VLRKKCLNLIEEKKENEAFFTEEGEMKQK